MDNPTQNQVFPASPAPSVAPTVPSMAEVQKMAQEQPAPIPTTPPPAPGMFTPTVASGEGGPAVPPKPKKGLPFKKILIFLGLLAFIGIFALLVIRLVLPRLGLYQKDVDLTWWGLWEDEPIVAPIIEEYQNQNPHVTVNYIAQSKEDYRERLINSLAQGNGPDIFRFHNTWVPNLVTALAPVPSEIISSEEFSQTYYPVAISDLSTSKGFVGLPLEYDGLGLYINEDIFNTYAKIPPASWDELKDLALELTIVDERGIIKQSGVALGNTVNVDHWPEIMALMMLQNGANLITPTDHLAEGALSYYAAFSNVYKVWDETLPSSTAMFASGKLAMYFAPSWRVFEILAVNPNLNFKIVPVPQLPKDNATDPDITYATYWVEGVWDESKNKDEAFKFLRYLSTPETLQKMYALAASSAPHRPFGEPYPRVDMQSLLTTDPYLGGIMALAGSAKSSYLASSTYDGTSGINSRLAAYWQDAINSIRSQGIRVSDKVLETLALGIQQVLSDYGLVAAPATPAP